MKKLKYYYILSGLFSIVTGLMLILLRGSVLSLLITVVGIGFIVSALAFSAKRLSKISLLKIIIGVCTIAFGNTFINLSMYILGIALIILGAFRFSSIRAIANAGRASFRLYIRPVSTLLAGICILFNPAGSIEALFFVCGILMAVGGAYDLHLGLTWRL